MIDEWYLRYGGCEIFPAEISITKLKKVKSYPTGETDSRSERSFIFGSKENRSLVDYSALVHLFILIPMLIWF